MTEEMVHDVFLSYPWEQREKMKGLLQQLSRTELRVWVDEMIPDWQPWAAAITDAMSRSRIFAILYGTESERDGVQRTEISEAIATASEDRSRKAVLIPIDGVQIGPSVDFLDKLSLEDAARKICDIEGALPPFSRPARVDVAMQKRDVREGAVLTCNVREFSKLLPFDQLSLTRRLFNVVQEYAAKVSDVHWVDFREGEFTIFRVKNPGARLETVEELIGFGYHLMATAWGGPQLGSPPVGIGVLVHWAEEVRWRQLRLVRRNWPQLFDVFRQGGSGQGARVRALTGSPLQKARMILASSNRQQLLITGAAERVLGDEAALVRALEVHGRTTGFLAPATGSDVCSFHPMDIVVSHRRTERVYSLCFTREGRPTVGDASPPRSRVSLDYRVRKDGDLRKNPFVMGLVECDEATVLGITHEGTDRFLHEALRIRERRGLGFWKHLRIVFPGESHLRQVSDQETGTKEGLVNRRERWESGRNRIYRFLMGHADGDHQRWECMDYDNTLPFLGQHFVVRDHAGRESARRARTTSSFRLAPILPGGDAADSFYFEVVKGMEPYERLEEAFGFIQTHSRPVVEWVVTGGLENEGGVRVSGLRELKRIGDLSGRYGAFVTLVVLHTDRAVLQMRDRRNATSGFGLYSNIAGRMTDADLLSALRDQGGTCSEVTAEAYKTQAYFGRTGSRGHAPAEPPTASFLVCVRELLGRDDPVLSSSMTDCASRFTALREMREELGIDIKADRLKRHTGPIDPGQGGRSGSVPRQFFQVHSLRLTESEIQDVESLRPNSKLERFDEQGVRDLRAGEKLNWFFRRRFDLFEGIYRELGIFAG